MTNSKTETKTNKDLKLSGKNEKNFICFNFNKIGHRVSKQPKCEKESCYHCGEFGHVIKNCPQIKTEKKEIANVEGEAIEEDFYKKRCLSNK